MAIVNYKNHSIETTPNPHDKKKWGAVIFGPTFTGGAYVLIDGPIKGKTIKVKAFDTKQQAIDAAKKEIDDQLSSGGKP